MMIQVWMFVICYRPQTKFAKVMFLHLSVSHSVHRRGFTSRYTPLGRYNPLGRYTPQVGTHWQVHPLGRYTPPGRYTLLAGTPPRQVHPLWAGTPLGRYTPWAGTLPSRYTLLGRYIPLGRYTPQASTTPPPAMHVGIRSTSGWYASYWNAFLFLCVFQNQKIL